MNGDGWQPRRKWENHKYILLVLLRIELLKAVFNVTLKQPDNFTILYNYTAISLAKKVFTIKSLIKSQLAENTFDFFVIFLIPF